MKKIPYNQRSDLEKINSNWKKASRLYKREEWSTVVLRSVTAVELSANFLIRKELQEKRGLEEDFVNHLLVWANGIRGKFEKLILPLFRGTAFHNDFKSLKKKVDTINSQRNEIAHSGVFKRETSARDVYDSSREIIEKLVSHYEKDFKLKY